MSQVEVYKRVGKSVIEVFKRAFNYCVLNRRPLWLNKFFIKHCKKMRTRLPKVGM